MEIKKVRKSGEQKIITIPAKSKMQVGDFVKIFKIGNEVPDPNLEEREIKQSQEKYYGGSTKK